MEIPLQSGLTGIALVALAALGCGMAMERLRQPAIVGYMLAGVLLGPSALGLVEDRAQINTLADLGVLLLLFLVGMELPLRLFRKLWRLALSATLMQIAGTVGVMLLLSRLFGWPPGLALLLGFVVALSSTAVAIKVMEDTGETKSRPGRIGVGVLIAQDLAFVPMILIIGIVAQGSADALGLFRIVASLALLGWLIWYLSGGRKIRLPFARLATGNRDMTPLTGLALCFGAAALSGLFGLSPAYGAFLAGLVIGHSDEGRSMIRGTRPIQSILMMVFFLSIGLLIDLAFIWENLGTVLMLLFLVTVFKTLLNTAIFKLLGQSWPSAFLTSVMLAQIGEFSFLLARTGLESGLIEAESMRLVVAVTALSLAISPVWVVTARRLHGLASASVGGFGELIAMVYGPEANMLRSVAIRTGPQLALARRRLAALTASMAAVLDRIPRRFRKTPAAANDDGEAGDIVPPEGAGVDGAEDNAKDGAKESNA